MEIISFTLKNFFPRSKDGWYSSIRDEMGLTNYPCRWDGYLIYSQHNVFPAGVLMYTPTNTLCRYNKKCFVLSQVDMTGRLVLDRLNSRCLRPYFSLPYSLVAAELHILHVISGIRVEFPSKEGSRFCAVVGRDRRLTNADYFLFGKFSLGAAFGVFLRKRSGASSGHVASGWPFQQEFILMVSIPVSFTSRQTSPVLQKKIFLRSYFVLPSDVHMRNILTVSNKTLKV
jgi:hypothetical protein